MTNKAAAERKFYLIEHEPSKQYYCNPDQFCNNPYMATKFHTKIGAEAEVEFLIKELKFATADVLKAIEYTWYFEDGVDSRG